MAPLAQAKYIRDPTSDGSDGAMNRSLGRGYPRAERALRIDFERDRNRFSMRARPLGDRKSTRLNSSHQIISYAVFCLKKKNKQHTESVRNTSTLYPDTTI